MSYISLEVCKPLNVLSNQMILPKTTRFNKRVLVIEWNLSRVLSSTFQLYVACIFYEVCFKFWKFYTYKLIYNLLYPNELHLGTLGKEISITKSGNFTIRIELPTYRRFLKTLGYCFQIASFLSLQHLVLWRLLFALTLFYYCFTWKSSDMLFALLLPSIVNYQGPSCLLMSCNSTDGDNPSGLYCKLRKVCWFNGCRTCHDSVKL